MKELNKKWLLQDLQNPTRNKILEVTRQYGGDYSPKLCPVSSMTVEVLAFRVPFVWFRQKRERPFLYVWWRLPISPTSIQGNVGGTQSALQASMKLKDGGSPLHFWIRAHFAV